MDIAFRLTRHDDGRIGVEIRVGTADAWTPVATAQDEQELAVVIGNMAGAYFVLDESGQPLNPAR